jgi:UDP-N-acetyl-D-galactosamine dehydrogenase
MKPIIAIVGIGYVGLQNAIAVAKAGYKTIAFDINTDRINELNQGIDKNYEVPDIMSPNLLFTDNPSLLHEANYYLISIPTPINEHQVPNLGALKSSSKLVSGVLRPGDIVVLESTVYPGATRDILIPTLEEGSGLKSNVDFYVGYSSERIVPGDMSHNYSNMTKVISGQSEEALQKIGDFYQSIFTLNLHYAPSIEVAEASKLLENIQRDVNIALMNEFTQIMGKMNISIYDVLEAANTKWNFLPFTPGLVGGHCIPEDPYYLIYQANKLGVPPNLISSARQTNEYFFHFIVDMTIKLMSLNGIALNGAKVAILGISFKPNVTDTRHSMSILLYKNLKEMGIDVVACDPVVTQFNTNLNWVELDDLKNIQALIICQAHNQFLEISPKNWSEKLAPNGVVIDIPGAYIKNPSFRDDITYWSL